MKFRQLGRTGIEVSEICLGTMTFGQQNTEAEGHAQLDMAIDKGINFFDTAELYSIPPRAETYGATETIIGSWLAARGNRDKIVLASKVVGRSSNLWFRDGEEARLTRNQIRYAVENSLRRLRTDYLDLYQLHWPDRHVNLFGTNGTTFSDLPEDDAVSIEETLGALGELVKEGKIRHAGLSNETAWGTSRFLHLSEIGQGPRVASIQNAYNLLNRTFEMGLAEIALREDVGLLAYSPLGQGYLTGKYQNGARPAGARTTLFNRGQRYEKPGVEEAINAYLALAREFNIDPVHMAIAFVTSRPFVTSNIIGATSLQQLEQILNTDNAIITPELEARINDIHQIHNNPAP
ncbi:MAG: aldo/keto reductase [Acetobacter sp.]|jgi:aryl-alcohol dehydrogenase-like predicted oxidoreductase|nr:aldo/keto reductase [Acetobacter sp.]MCH4061834.1 aldo/keto reductase [Acetobacter sp.]MCH4089317.1 aldo/keto reductase [Acetobacter sp.]MCI1294205.1 aldo/keto reductase [Acetobacter sp.]MCI1320790.1 aldo/keto reductase [Acetobacter sp.]